MNSCAEIPITWHSYGGWFLDHTVGTGHKNVELRTANIRQVSNEPMCLHIAKGMVQTKIMIAGHFCGATGVAKRRRSSGEL